MAIPSLLLFPTSVLAQKPIQLLETLPDGTSSINVTTTCGAGLHPAFCALNSYLQPFIPFLVGISAGAAMLMIVLGGVQMIFGGGDQSKFDAGKKRIIASIIGLLLLVFSATILNFLNANYFQLGVN